MKYLFSIILLNALAFLVLLFFFVAMILY